MPWSTGHCRSSTKVSTRVTVRKIQPLSTAPRAPFLCTLFSMLMFKVAQRHNNSPTSGPLFFLSQLPQVHLPSSLFHGDPDAVSGRTRDSILQVRLLRTPLEGGLIREGGSKRIPLAACSQP